VVRSAGRAVLTQFGTQIGWAQGWFTLTDNTRLHMERVALHDSAEVTKPIVLQMEGPLNNAVLTVTAVVTGQGHVGEMDCDVELAKWLAYSEHEGWYLCTPAGPMSQSASDGHKWDTEAECRAACEDLRRTGERGAGARAFEPRLMNALEIEAETPTKFTTVNELRAKHGHPPLDHADALKESIALLRNSLDKTIGSPETPICIDVWLDAIGMDAAAVVHHPDMNCYNTKGAPMRPEQWVARDTIVAMALAPDPINFINIKREK